MSQCCVVLLGKGMPFPAQYALPWLISWPLIVTLFTAWPTSIGMLVGERWGFLLGLTGSVPFIYTAILIYIWDRDLGFRRQTLFYWAIVWGMFPAFGVIELLYCLTRLLAE